MPSFTPPPDQVERFRHAYQRLADPPPRIGLAVSGGADSLALLLLASAAYPGRIHVATVDHRLRKESAIEALHVEDLCGRLDCPHTILEVTVPSGSSGLQAEARRVRYDALVKWGESQNIPHVATAHHADDQAETLLMRLQRGSGLSGLSGIRPLRRDGEVHIVRPLLGYSKAELVHLVGAAGVEPVEDPSNYDLRFDRAAMRRFLRDNPQFHARRIALTASAIREADEALDWAAAELAEDRITVSPGEMRIDPQGLPRELRRRLLIRGLASLRQAHGIAPPRGGFEDVEGLMTSLEQGDSGTLGGVAARGGHCWHLRPAPPRRPTRAFQETNS
jgi:tRNA(Ile)-lysidine synthase